MIRNPEKQVEFKLFGNKKNWLKYEKEVLIFQYPFYFLFPTVLFIAMATMARAMMANIGSKPGT